MPKIKDDLPLAPLERILKRAGAKRVSKGAAREFSVRLSEYMQKVATESAVLARHAGRKTIVEADVKMAAKRISI